jgi:hypothetical protein
MPDGVQPQPAVTTRWAAPDGLATSPRETVSRVSTGVVDGFLNDLLGDDLGLRLQSGLAASSEACPRLVPS